LQWEMPWQQAVSIDLKIAGRSRDLTPRGPFPGKVSKESKERVVLISTVLLNRKKKPKERLEGNHLLIIW
ncbi:hypothetical protein CRENBAI_016742, partial [Crenichthys baileyi]